MTRDRSNIDKLDSRRLASPVGELTLVASSQGLCAVLWPVEREGRVPITPCPTDERRGNVHLDTAEEQLDQYFSQTRSTFEIELDLSGTEFQKMVWEELVSIDHGLTTTYTSLASRIGKPTAARAVGAAVGRNPVSIIVPCHRVVGASGALTGFAGGLATKRFLLDLEAGTPQLTI